VGYKVKSKGSLQFWKKEFPVAPSQSGRSIRGSDPDNIRSSLVGDPNLNDMADMDGLLEKNDELIPHTQTGKNMQGGKNSPKNIIKEDIQKEKLLSPMAENLDIRSEDMQSQERLEGIHQMSNIGTPDPKTRTEKELDHGSSPDSNPNKGDSPEGFIPKALMPDSLESERLNSKSSSEEENS
jgi:hypothetical protein